MRLIELGPLEDAARRRSSRLIMSAPLGGRRKSEEKIFITTKESLNDLAVLSALCELPAHSKRADNAT